MRTSTSSSFCLLALAATNVAAQSYSNQSDVFSLVLKSSNSTLNTSILFPCHSGAAIESICVGTTPSVNISTAYFTFNTTEDVEPVDYGTTGILTYELIGGNFQLSSPMSFGGSNIANVSVPIFTPRGEVVVAFDSQGELNIQGYNRWYACVTVYLGYTYQTLAWVTGSGATANPSCVKVDVLRVFA